VRTDSTPKSSQADYSTFENIAMRIRLTIDWFHLAYLYRCFPAITLPVRHHLVTDERFESYRSLIIRPENLICRGQARMAGATVRPLILLSQCRLHAKKSSASWYAWWPDARAEPEYREFRTYTVLATLMANCTARQKFPATCDSAYWSEQSSHAGI
jgi:hypothetical protein